MRRIVLPIFEIAFCVLLISCLILKASGNSNFFTLEGFLHLIENAPHFDFLSTSPFTIDADWGVFDFLRVFIESLGQIFTLTLNLAIEVMNTIIFIVYFVSNLFFIVPASPVVA